MALPEAPHLWQVVRHAGTANERTMTGRGKSGIAPAGEAESQAEALDAGEALFRRRWMFVKSVPALEFLPPADRVEVAFAGRSNVGKSSLINTVIGQGSLARTSNTPGRTQELNYFEAQETGLYLVDMPGYGFAEAPKAKVDAWTALVKDYLRGRATLKRVYLLIDARHGIKPIDITLMEMLDKAGVAYQVVLTKMDKISKAAGEAVLARTTAALTLHPAALPKPLATSSQKRLGLEALRTSIAALLGA
jgi:GTP-binding protein